IGRIGRGDRHVRRLRERERRNDTEQQQEHDAAQSGHRQEAPLPVSRAFRRKTPSRPAAYNHYFPMSDVTQLLREWNAGAPEARDRLMHVVYQPLRQIADRHLMRERGGHTLQPTALVNELYLRLAD